MNNKDIEFVLPKYWYIKIEPDNIDLIQQWRKDVFNFTNDISGYYCIYENGYPGPGRGWCSGVGLSTEQFKEHVLKQPKSEHTKEDYSYLINFLKKIQ